MSRILIFLLSLIGYGSFVAVFVYLTAFLANVQTTALAEAFPVLETLVPYSIDYGRSIDSLPAALVIDLGLILLFGIQHSVMARPGFKRAWTRVIPKKAERSVYVLLSSLVLAFVMWQWQPNPSPLVWHAESDLGVAVGYGVMGLGVVTLLWATFLIDHFELMGLRQGWAALQRRAVEPPKFVTPYLYKFVRHPQYVGWLLIFWGTPTMTAGHLLFAAGFSAYIVIAMHYEERDLIEQIGTEYRAYREQVPSLVPMPGKRYEQQVSDY